MKYFFDFMLNGFLVWFNVFLLNPNPGESFRSPLCGKTDVIKLYKTCLDYARNVKIGTMVEAPIYILVYIFYNNFSIQTPTFFAKKNKFLTKDVRIFE